MRPYCSADALYGVVEKREICETGHTDGKSNAIVSAYRHLR